LRMSGPRHSGLFGDYSEVRTLVRRKDQTLQQWRLEIKVVRFRSLDMGASAVTYSFAKNANEWAPGYPVQRSPTSTYYSLSGRAQAKITPPVPVTTYWRLSSS